MNMIVLVVLVCLFGVVSFGGNVIGTKKPPANPFEKDVDKNMKWVRYTDVSYNGLPFLGVSRKENLRNQEHMQLVRARGICLLAGYEEPTLVKLNWVRENMSVYDVSITDDCYLSSAPGCTKPTAEAQQVYVDDNGPSGGYSYAVITDISCTKE